MSELEKIIKQRDELLAAAKLALGVWVKPKTALFPGMLILGSPLDVVHALEAAVALTEGER